MDAEYGVQQASDLRGGEIPGGGVPREMVSREAMAWEAMTREAVAREPMAPGMETQEKIAWETISGGALLRSFYAGEQIPCPVGCGGTAHAVRVGTLADGCGELWLECSCCAQRERVMVPPATSHELSVLPILPAPGETLLCPRHAGRVPLRQQGRRLICPECGVRFRE